MKYFYFIKADIAYMYLLNEYAQKKRFPLWKTQKILLNYCKSIDTKSVQMYNFKMYQYDYKKIVAEQYTI